MQYAGRERSERRLRRMKRGERVAAVEKIEHPLDATIFSGTATGSSPAVGWTTAAPF